ncbi:hypothetical protein FA13DRAFT_1676791 [Coprinellus micaceus]|uniref:Post-SET domain-containing protein n=1 Tax=Coprinellus micaceus TaxID=71717 RepID=A0A4Y7S0P0_COPMI|nr:hypothetical protein FA13DRAFT_1676791 [Coprinellus micaceus]
MDNQFPQEQTLNLGINVEHPSGGEDPPKRRPGRPKGSVKKALLGTETPSSSKVKRPVGRPRKDGLPAGSVPGSSKTKRERPPQQQPMQFVPETVQQPVAYPSAMSVYPPGPQQPAPQQFVSAQPVIQIDPSLTADDWATLARTDANQFLSVLLQALAAPNPVSTAGPTVEEAFKSHLMSVTPNANQVNPIPTLYSILKTFWLPSSPAYFSLTASAASTSRTSSEHRFLYWDPLPLVFQRDRLSPMRCPLLNKGRITNGPLKIYDIEKPFFVIGCEYVCKGAQCTTPATPEGRKFASTDSSILRALPVKLKDEFPAKLLYDNADAGSGPNIWNWKALGVSWSLWNMVHGALRAGLKKETICFLITSIQRGVPNLEEPPRDVQPQQQQQQQQPQHQQQQDAMQQDDESQTLQTQHEEPTNNLSEAYSNAWRENTAVATDNAVKSPAPPPAQQQSASAAITGNTPNQNFPYPYPFVPYAYMSHQTMVNGQMVPISSTPSQVGTSVSVATPQAVDAPPPAPQPPQQEVHATPAVTAKRSPRHCCKCGSQDCKGKGGRNFCMNACQDCGKLDCKGRNSRRPDKKCSEGWI